MTTYAVAAWEAKTVARIADCPLARTVDAIGGWWALEVLHEVFNGYTRAEMVARNLELPVEVALERLTALVAAGILSRGEQGDHEPTEAGRELRSLLVLMAVWGNRELPPQQRSVVLADPDTGRELDPVVVDRTTGEPLDTTRCVFAAGPAAGPHIRARYPDATRFIPLR